MSKNKNQNILYLKILYLNIYIHSDAINLYGYTKSIFLPTNGFKWIDPKGVDSNKYSSNISKGCVLEVNFECSKNYQNYIMIIL